MKKSEFKESAVLNNGQKMNVNDLSGHNLLQETLEINHQVIIHRKSSFKSFHKLI